MAAQAASYALKFDETDDAIEVPYSPDMHLNVATDWFVGAWVKVGDLSGTNGQFVASWNNQGAANSLSLFLVEGSSAGKPRLVVMGETGEKKVLTGSQAIPLNTWVYLVAQNNTAAGALELWMAPEGQAASKVASLGTANFGDINKNASLYLGRRTNSPANRWFGGEMQQFTLGRHAFTQAELDSIAGGASIASVAADLRVNLQLNDGTGATATDTAKANHATLTGFDTSTAWQSLTAGQSAATRERVTTYTFHPSYDRKTERVTETIGTVETLLTDRTYHYLDNYWLGSITDHLDTDGNNTIDYSYDNNGNPLTKVDNTQPAPESTVFSYNTRNQLVSVIRGPPGAETGQGSYEYNFAGMRIRHLNSERGDIEYLYDDKSILSELVNNTSTLVAHYRYADRLISLKTPGGNQYYHYATLGTTANLTNDTGDIQIAYRVDPFGTITEQQGSSVNRQVFTGQEHDEQTGLIYFGARFYDPDTGRFLNQDTYLGEPGTPPSLHRYLYAYGNPTVWIDLHGYLSQKDLADASRNAYDHGDIVGGVALSLVEGLYVIGNEVTGGAFESHDQALGEGYSGIDALVETGKKQKDIIHDWAQERAEEGVVEGTAGVVCGVIRACKGAAKIVENVYDKVKDHVDDVAENAKAKLQKSKTAETQPIDGRQQRPDTSSSAVSNCSCGPRCFVAGTLISTKNGLTPIEEIKLGDLVASRDENNPNGAIEWKPVTELFYNDDDRITYLVTLRDESGNTDVYEVTDNHPFYVESRGWVDVGYLEGGMQVPSSDGSLLTVVGVEALNISPITYNIEVDEFHTYFVGKQGAWVHNQNPDCPPCPTTGNNNVTQGEVGDFRDTASRSKKDGLTPDHQPAKSVLYEDFKRRKGRDPTKKERIQIENEANCIVIKTCTHMSDSETYGGRINSKQSDGRTLKEHQADDLRGAVDSNMDALTGKLQQDGLSMDEIQKARDELHLRNEADGVYDGSWTDKYPN